MIEAFSSPFMVRALAAGAMVGALCSVLSVYVVMKRWAFIGQGISHAAFGGVALGLLLGVSVSYASLVFCLATAYLIGVASRRQRVSADSAIGIFLTASMALGVLLIALRRAYSVDVFSYLFGNILATTPEDLGVTAGVAGAVLVFVVLFYKELLFFTFDDHMAGVSGVPVTFFYYALLTMVSLVIVVAIKVVGLVLVNALLVLPAVITKQLSHDFREVMGLGVAVTLVSVFVGLFISYTADIPSGATIVLALFAFFLVAMLLGSRQRLRTD